MISILGSLLCGAVMPRHVLLSAMLAHTFALSSVNVHGASSSWSLSWVSRCWCGLGRLCCLLPLVRGSRVPTSKIFPFQSRSELVKPLLEVLDLYCGGLGALEILWNVVPGKDPLEDSGVETAEILVDKGGFSPCFSF